MPNNYFITGLPKIGKTTLLQKLADKMSQNGLRVGGFLSPEQKVHGTRTGFVVQDIETGRVERLASLDIDGPRVSKYHVDKKSFDSLVQQVQERIRKYDVVVIDEIGRMEMKSEKFGDLLIDLLESNTPVVASLHRDYVEDYKAWGEVFILNLSNRNRLYMELIERVGTIKKKTTGKSGPTKIIKKVIKKGKRKPEKKQKKGKEKKKSKRKEEDLDLMTEDILRHHHRGHHGTKHHEEEIPMEERKEEIMIEKEEERRAEMTPDQIRKRKFREWVREHVGI